jgi:cytochrome b6-f complex iron-sulfur subunit
MANLLLGIAATAGLGMLGTRFLEFLSPPAPPEREVEVLATSLDAIPDGGGTIAHLPGGHVALQRTGSSVRAFSAVCTHLGCIIQYRPQGDQAWVCPCHRGRYARDGKVLGGPPPRPLAAIPATVRDGNVYVTLTVRPPAGLV